MTDLLSRIRRASERWGLLPAEGKVLVAVSGGADSVALLHALVRLAAEDFSGLSLEVAHLDHGLRGAESAEDARFVAALAEGLGLPCSLERLPEGALRRRGTSIEEAAREARLAFLERTAERIGAERIALAHTADDLAEEVLMRLLQGAGGRGLAGMRPRRGKYVRPLIECGRAEVREWLAAQGIAWREDSTNLDRRHLRNRVRHDLLPQLEAGYNPSLREALGRQAAILGDEDDLLDRLAEGRLAELARTEEDAIILPCAGLGAEHPALQRRLLRLAAGRLAGGRLAGGLRGVGFAHIEAVRGLLESAQPSAALRLPGGLEARRRYGELLLSRRAEPAGEWGYELPGPGTYELPEAGCRLTLSLGGEGREGRGSALFEAGALSWPLLVRGPRRGDRFQPRGLAGGHKKIFRLLADLKVPRAERGAVPVLLSGAEIIWVCGLRAAEFARPTGAGPVVAARMERASAG